MEGEGSQKPGPKLLILLYASLLLNILLLYHFLSTTLSSRHGSGGSGYGSGELRWARQAAEEAEAVAAIDCSGHGRAHIDSILGPDGAPARECNKCFGGANCSVRVPGCVADVESGDPMFLEPYWMRHAAASAVVVSGWHRMSYMTTDEFMSVELEHHVRLLHKAVGNAAVDGKFMVFGTGSTQLLNALVHALSPRHNASSPPASVVATPPYYPTYKTQTDLFDGREYEWHGTTTEWENASRSRDPARNVVEFVTSPNNPDGLLHDSVVGSSSAIYDHAYYWPHFTHVPAPADEDVMLFSISKLSGHASSRFGWALIRDEKVAKKARTYLQENTMGVSRDTQLRVLKVIKVILSELHSDEDIFAFGHSIMRSRWRKLSAVVSLSSRFSLQKISPQYCTYYKRIRAPSPAYAWVKCEMEEDIDCYQVLLKANIISRAGDKFEAGSRFARLSLIKSQDDFNILLERMVELVDRETLRVPAPSYRKKTI